nr:hypothetical protein [Solanum melongena]WMB97141.1 hypothetical protein [Solanum aethiopicum]
MGFPSCLAFTIALAFITGGVESQMMPCSGSSSSSSPLPGGDSWISFFYSPHGEVGTKCSTRAATPRSPARTFHNGSAVGDFSFDFLASRCGATYCPVCSMNLEYTRPQRQNADN